MEFHELWEERCRKYGVTVKRVPGIVYKMHWAEGDKLVIVLGPPDKQPPAADAGEGLPHDKDFKDEFRCPICGGKPGKSPCFCCDNIDAGEGREG